ncbi:baseplate hub subunit tail lysozyme [Synechococcus phage S-8S29]|nr:baseplate hub subunit tail lysozyme [Synechococcus phage S-8S29]
MALIDGIVNEPTVNFVGKDGFTWWIGEVEFNKDPMELGRVKVRVLGYYTNVRGGTTADLPTDYLPWATVLQHTSQPGNDGQGESSGQLQPGAIVMGFFMDGENAQMPVVIGVMRVNKSAKTKDKQTFAFTGEKMEPGIAPNPASLPIGEHNTMKEGSFKRAGEENNSVATPNMKTLSAGGAGSPNNIGNQPGIAGSSSNPSKPREPKKPIPAANGVGGPWKTLEYKLGYLLEDIADTAGNLVSAENGDFLDVVTGKLVTAKALTAKLQNFLGAVFTQVVSAIRQSLANLAEELELVNLLGGITGAPYIIFTTIQTAVTTILSSLCSIDSQIIGFVADPIGSVLSIVEGFLEGAIDKAAMVVQGVQAVIDGVVCKVQGLLDTVLQIVDTVSTIVKGVQQAQEIIEAWKTASGIFEDGMDLFKKGIKSISGLIALFIKFAASNCNRKPDGGSDTVGWFPLFGVTHCTDAELDAIDKIRGSNRGSCGDSGGGGSLIDSIFKEADPYLTQAKTFLDGSYEMFVGTPGRRASVKKTTSGTTHQSVKLDNNERQAAQARSEIAKKNPELTKEQVEEEVEKFTKSQAPDGDTGNLTADHSSYAGNYTREVHGDECALIDGHETITVEGDYHLKITGNCHIEVGGGFFFDAEGAPTMVDVKNGEKKSDKIQKHTIKFGSDVDINTVGAKFEVQGAECNLASISTKVTGSLFENSSSQQSYSGAEIIMSGDNSIEINTPHLYEFINMPITGPVITAGITRLVGGSVDTIQTPGLGSDVIPRHTIVNPLGPISMTCGATGFNCNVTTGAFNVNVVAGLINMNASLACTLNAGGAMTLSAIGVVSVNGLSIFLN